MERTLIGTTVIELGGEVTPRTAEDVVVRLAEVETGSQLTVRFPGYPDVAPGAGWRIGNALRRFSGAPLTAHVPPFGEEEWFRAFTRSGLGYALGSHAGRILEG